MSHKEIRPFPVTASVVMRSTLFALATMKAKLQAYNEETGVIVATLSKRLGLQKHEIIGRIRGYGDNAQLELETPDVKVAQELLDLVGKYVTDGGKVEANARIQWLDHAREQANKAKRQETVNRVRAIIPGVSSTPTPPPVAPMTEDGETVVGEPGTAIIPIPDNPGVLVKNEQDQIIELKIDPSVFVDRTDHLDACDSCAATVMRGSLYCPNCGRPMTLEAVQPELRTGVEETAKSSLNFALLGLAFNAIPLALLILPALIGSSDLTFLDKVGEWLNTPIVVAVFALGIVPMVLAGWRAISLAQRASWYQNLSAMPDKVGRGRAMLSHGLAYFDIYLAIAWILFIVIALF